MVLVVMIMSDADLYRLASWSTWVSLVALVISGVALAIFFAGPGEPFGSINDAFIALALVALIPAVLAVDRLAGSHGAPIVRIATVAAIAGIVLAAVGQVLLILRVITLEDSYITGGLGILPVLAWILLVAVLALGPGILPALVGWLAALVLLAIVATSVVATVTLGPVLWVACLALVAALVAWLASLALAFAVSVPQAAWA
jgi:hypothetical protein